MAKSKDSSEQTTVTRVKAQDDTKSTKKPAKASNKKTVAPGDIAEPKKNIFKRFIGYFKGAWFELKQVRWPNRKATWGMTAALLIFTGLFVGFIVMIDLLWEYLFKLILR